MEIPILATKLYIPAPHPTAIVRQALLARLTRGVTGKATLVVAPAGFGKSTLVGQWVQSITRPTAWLTLDDADNDLSRFWHYLIAALRSVHPQLGEQSLTLLHSLQPPPVELMMTTLVNELAQVVEGLVLVLDEYHQIEQPAIHHIVDFLLTYAPPDLHIVLIARQEPPLSVAKLRARGAVNEIDGEALRFSASEVAAFFAATTGTPLGATSLATMVERTAGWAAGLRLAATLVQRATAKSSPAPVDDLDSVIAAFHGDERHVFDYLTTEIFDQLPPARQRFLVQTALLDRLCGDLCDAVTDSTHSQQILEALAHENLFLTPLDNEGRWFAYHALFADFLRHRLRQWDRIEVNTLHQRAAHWYADQALPEAAIAHALAAEDYTHVAQLIETNAMRMVHINEIATLMQTLAALPRELCEQSPLLAFAQAGVALMHAQFQRAQQWIEVADQALAALPPHAALPFDVQMIQGYLDALRSTVVVNLRGEVTTIITISERALRNLPADETYLRGAVALNLGDAYARRQATTLAEQAFAEAIALTESAKNLTVHLAALASYGALVERQGRLAKAAAIYQRAITVGRGWGGVTGESHPVTGKAHAFYARVLYAWNQVAAAEEHARLAVTYSRQWGHDRHIIDGYLELVKALAAQGKYAEVETTLAAARLHAKAARTAAAQQDKSTAAADELLADIEGLQWRLWLQQGRHQDVLDHLTANPSGASASLLARLALVQEAWSTAEIHLRNLHRQITDHSHYIRRIQLHLLWAQLRQGQGKVEQALVTLQQALALGEPEGYVRVFLDEGPPITQLLQVANHQQSTPYLRTIVGAAIPQPTPHTPFIPQSTSQPAVPPVAPVEQLSERELVEQLSERELDVLRLMADDLTYEDIGERLFISLNTVRTHIKHIYGKLEVQRRNQAVQRAQELGLL